MALGEETVSTHTVKNDATTTIVTRTTTIVSEHQEILAEPTDSSPGVVENVRRTFRDYWFPSHHHHHHPSDNQEDDDDDETDTTQYRDPTRWKVNGVMRRAYDYWKTLTQDADEAAKALVIEAKKARDEAAAEAKWAFLGYKKEAREAYEAADKKYRDALAAAERVHEEAHEKAKQRWFQAVDSTEKEVEGIKDQAADITHKKWDRFKNAVNSLAYNPPKYGCYPSGSQYWFSTSGPSKVDWDCREIWDHPRRNDHSHLSIKTLPKKHLPLEKVHDTLTGLFSQARTKARHAPSATTFEAGLKPVQDQYHHLLDRASRADEKAIDELDGMVDSIKAKLNELKFYEEQTDSWLTSQWNAVVDSAGDHKNHYERVFKNTLRSVKNTRTEIYNSLLNNLQRTVNLARNNINEAIHATKDLADKSRVHKAVQDANDAFAATLRDAEAKIKAAPRSAYDNAIDTFNRDTAYLKAKLEHAAHVASKSASSVSHHASKSGSSISHHASKSGSSALHEASKSASSAIHRVTGDAKSLADDAESEYHSATDKARQGYEEATASINSMWASATPNSPIEKVKAGYHKTLDGVHHHWFSDADEPRELNASSVYGAVLAGYFIYLAFRIWRARSLARMADPKKKTFSVVKNGDHPDGTGEHSATIEKYRVKPSAEEALDQDRDSFGTVLLQFTSVVPVTLILLILLELGGFSRAALHTLFLGLITAQMMQGGLLNDVLKKMGIVDGVHASGRDVGTYISWGVLSLAALANAVKVLQAQAA